MSVSLYKYTPACDGEQCPGDCDLCGKAQLSKEDATFNAENVEPNATQDVQSVGCVGDYISRQAAIDDIEKWRGYIDKDMVLRIVTRFKVLPSADVRENRHGAWKYYGHDFFGDYEYRCTACGNTANYETNFCPNCGADMRPDNAPLADDDSIYG